MANTPTPRSYNEILGDMVDAFLSKSGLSRLKTGTPILSTLEATAQSQLRSSEDIFTLLEAQSLDNSSGLALDRHGADESLARITESPATGVVTITDTSFTKVSSKVFQGTAAPIIGSTTINVVDASLFDAAGSVYIGRGTNNYEGPLAYTSILPPGSGPGQSGGSYYALVLSSGTQRFHNVGESVIMAQGGTRTIAAGTVVQTPQGNAVAAVTFKTRFLARIPDGETSVEGVQVIAQKPGIVGNVTARAISEFASEPFTGATVTNPLPFTNGTPSEDDDSYRERIRAIRQARAKGTPLALETAVIGVVALDENKRILSASCVPGTPTILYVDDGNGYEERDEGVAIESLTDYASGGESYFRVSAARPVAKAFVLTSNTAPFALGTGEKLAVLVGDVLSEHTFDADEFLSIESASAYEVVASINSNPTLDWAARTYDNGTKVAIFAKEESNESIQVVTPDGDDANDALGFSTTRVDTMRLYKNDRLLSKDGALASLTSNATSAWTGLTGSQSLVIRVDGNTLSFDGSQFDEFSSQDFIDADTGYTTLGPNTPEAWAAVFTYRIPGVTATAVAGRVVLTSNRGRSSDAALEIVSGSLVTNGMFDTGSSEGADNDYTLDRNTGELKLTSQLVLGDRLAAGSESTRAFLETDPITLLSVTDATLWFAVDSEATRVLSGLTASTPVSITVENRRVMTWGLKARVTSTTSADLFANVEGGDYAVFWDASSPVALGEYRVGARRDTYFEIDVKQLNAGRYAHRVVALDDDTFLVVGGFVGPNAHPDDGSADIPTCVSATCEIYDPATGVVTQAASMDNPRAYHTATKLADGRVLVTGGITSRDGVILDSCEIYDPGTDTWVAADSLAEARCHHEAVLLPDDTVLTCGGTTEFGSPDTVTNTTEIYTPGTDSWASSGNMTGARRHFTLGVFASGNVAAAGGESASACRLTLERWVAGTWTNIGNLTGSARCHLRSIVTGGTIMYITGGSTATSDLADAPVTTVTSYTDGGAIAGVTAMTYARARHGMCLLNGGNIVVWGGHDHASSNGSGRPERLGVGWTNLPNPLSYQAAPAGANRWGNVLMTIPGTDDFVSFGGMAEDYNHNFASVETYVDADNDWVIRHPYLTDSVLMSEAGVQFVRSNAPLQRVVVDAGTNYTASTIADAINDALLGATASVYRTTTLRVRTNTFNDVEDMQEDVLAGDIGVLAQNTNGADIGLPLADVTTNLTGHMASVESGNYEYGTPDFHQMQVVDTVANDQLAYAWSRNTAMLNLQMQADWTVSNLLVGMRAMDDFPGETVDGVEQYRWGNIQGYVSAIKSRVDGAQDNADTITLRAEQLMGWTPEDRLYFAAPYQIGPSDQLTVLIDQDVEQKRFTLPMWRTLTTVGNTYGSTNTFVDGDNADLTLASAFGYTGGPADPFDFDDFAVFMPARVKAYSDVSDASILWRYYRLGPDGNSALVRFTYPEAEDSDVEVLVDPELDYSEEYHASTGIDVVLGSGPLRSGFLFTALTKIGEVRPLNVANNSAVYYIFAYPVASATRNANVTTLTLTLPAMVTDHGLQVGETYNFVSTSGSFNGGDKVITARSATTISYADNNANIGPIANVGRVYLGPGLTGDLSGAGVQQYDFFRLETSAATDPDFEGQTVIIGNDPASNPYWVEGLLTWTSAPGTSTTVTIYTLGDLSALKVFENKQQTAEEIVTAVNALTNSPIRGTNLDGGTGVIFKSSADMSLNGLYYDGLSDGVNYIKNTTPPGVPSGNYSLEFKNDVAAGLVSDADWENETVRLVPRTAKNIADWLNAGAVSGLYTTATTERSSRGHKVQISSLTAGSDGSVQVQGGGANAATATIVGSAVKVGSSSSTMVSQIAAADADALFAGQYVAIDNTVVLPKSGIFVYASTLDYIKLVNSTGQYALDTDVYTLRAPKSEGVAFRIERHGRFLCFSTTNYGNSVDDTDVAEGDWVRISSTLGTVTLPEISSVNTGIYRIVRVVRKGVDSGEFESADAGYTTSFWVENANGLDQYVAQCDVMFFEPDSMLPGDSLVVSSNFWGAGNRGTWAIDSVGSASSTVGVGEMTRIGNTVTVALPNTSPVYKHGLAVGDYFDISPGESDFPAGRYQVQSVADDYTLTYDDTNFASATSAGVQLIVGLPFQNPKVFAVSNASATSAQVTASPGQLGSAYPLFQCFEGTPGRYIKQIQTISPNNDSEDLADVKFNTAERYSQISEAAGSILTVLDKLDFSTTLAQGLDGYKHAIGLIGEANRVIYGDPDDPATYPGYAAAGATINIQGPLVKRIQVALGIRVRSGSPKQDIEDRVKSAVAAVINAAGVGESISLSSIINAASAVPGVVAVTPINPVLTSTTDLITVQAYEKPLVINLDQDVTVSFVGD